MNKNKQAIVQISLSILCLIIIIVQSVFIRKEVGVLDGVLIGIMCVLLIVQLVAYKYIK